MPLEFSDIESRLVRKLGDPDLASALTRELQTHFAGSLLSRLEAGYSEEDALAGAEREIGSARQLVQELAAPHVASDRKAAFWAPCISVIVLILNIFCLNYIVGGMGRGWAYLGTAVLVASVMGTLWWACRARTLLLIEPLAGAAVGICASIWILGLYWIPMGEALTGAPAFMAKEFWGKSAMYSVADNARFDRWAAEGWAAFRDPNANVPAVYRAGEAFLAPADRALSGNPWPKVDYTKPAADQIPILQSTSREEAMRRWKKEVRLISDRRRSVELDQEIKAELETAYSLNYFEKVARIAPMIWNRGAFPVVWFYWATYMAGSLVGLAVRRRRRGRSRPAAW